MEINLPVRIEFIIFFKFMSGLELIKAIRELIRTEIIDKSFFIANTSYVDLNTKLECFRNGMDYFLAKPFDLIELAAII
jgi:CheY-like chemotaxis protein